MSNTYFVEYVVWEELEAGSVEEAVGEMEESMRRPGYPCPEGKTEVEDLGPGLFKIKIFR